MESGKTYGSLEDKFKKEGIKPTEDVSLKSAETLDMETSEIETSNELLSAIDLKRKARQIQVSTEDSEVKAYLRQLGDPICFFGEDAADRRERLRHVLAVRGESGIRQKQAADKKQRQEENTLWYHEGSDLLSEVRLWLAEYSIPRAKERLDRAREFYTSVPEAQRKARVLELNKEVRTISLECSQIGDSRPLSYCSFSPDGLHLATASWSGQCCVWSVPDCNPEIILKGHEAQAGCIVWHPKAGKEDIPISLASAAQDGTVKLWSMTSEAPIADIEGHAPYRVSRLDYHPSGRLLATACFDHSWRLWDLEAGEEVLHQEGHSKPVYALDFHSDGSLLLSGGLDSFGRVWDLRTGRCVVFLEGHLEGVLAVAFSPNGYHMVTGSEDHTAKIWDLRQRQCLYTLPAHTGVINTVKFQPNDSNYIITGSFDKTAKLWGHPIWTPLRILAGHEGRVTCADITPDSKYIATCSFDRTFKLWTADI